MTDVQMFYCVIQNVTIIYMHLDLRNYNGI